MSEDVKEIEGSSAPFVLAPGVEALAETERNDAEREALLANAVQWELADGGRVESQGQFQAVLVKGRRPNHLLHLLISIVTIGIWCSVWIVITIVGGERRTRVEVDRFGNVFVRPI